MKVNEHERFYNRTYYQSSKDSDILEDKKLAAVFKENMPFGKKILDVGCGPGVTLRILTRNNSVFGIDLVDEYLRMAKENGYYRTIKCNVEDGLVFNSSSFDIVVCTDVIEHIFNTEFLGQEINRVLKRGGYAILNVPNHYALPYRINLLLGKGINRHQDIIEDWNYWHIRFFTWKSWNRYLKKMKFKIVEFYPVPIILNKLYLPEPIARKYPNLFSSRFLVKVVKM